MLLVSQYAVCGDNEKVAGCGLQDFTIEARNREQAEWELRLAGLRGNLGSGVPMNDRRAGSESVKDAAVFAEPESGEGGVHLRLFDSGKNSIEALEEQWEGAMRLALAGVKERGAHRGFQHAHQDTGLQSVPGDIGQVGDHVSVREKECVDEVTAYFIAGTGDAADIEAG